MRSSLVPFATASLLSAMAATMDTLKQSLAPLEPRVVGGNLTIEGEFPYVGGVTLFDPHLQGQAFWCPVLLLNPYTALTTANCAGEVDKITVQAGGVDANVALKDVNVTEAVIKSSIALFHLTSPITKNDEDKISYATLPEQGYKAPLGSNITIVGWGRTDCENTYTEELQRKVTIPVTSTSDCKTTYVNSSGYIVFTDDMFCAGVADGSRGGSGDLGSPIIGPDGTTAIGLWWGTYNCIDMNMIYPEVMINLGDYTDWIKSHVWTT